MADIISERKPAISFLLAAKELPADALDLVPVRMLNEYAFCPRLGYLMWVQGESEDNYFIEDGRYQHRRVDEAEGAIPPPTSIDPEIPTVARSVWLSAPVVGMTAKIDLVESRGTTATPVDYKRGRKPDVPGGAWEPERVQLCAQGLILAENGFACTHGILYFVESKTRVEIPFDDPLKERTRFLLARFRETAEAGVIPPPLDHSRKCEGCSLSTICLPDELDMLAQPPDEVRREPRQLVPALDDALPVYVQAQGAVVGKSGDELIIKVKGEKVASAKLFETSQVNLMGNVQISTQTVQELCRRGIPIMYLSSGGWFYGMTTAAMHKNIELRLHQYRCATSSGESLALARRFISAKIRNCRTMLRRNGSVLPETLRQLREAANDAETVQDAQILLGVEGNAARVYFQSFASMLKTKELKDAFDFDGRNRRPPLDPVNAMLSLAYSLLAKDLAVTLAAVGFDPHLGFYHRPRYGRPSLALDLMEEFRPIVADSVVITCINTGLIQIGDFVGRGLGVNLNADARKRFILAYERRMDQLVRHPVFGYQISYRRVLEVQARLLGRFLSGEIPEYPQFLTR
jgi:CRISPR-associated protein Cas1